MASLRELSRTTISKRNSLSHQTTLKWKAPGADSIPAEVYKLGGIQLILRLVDLFSLIWHEE